MNICWICFREGEYSEAIYDYKYRMEKYLNEFHYRYDFLAVLFHDRIFYFVRDNEPIFTSKEDAYSYVQRVNKIEEEYHYYRKIEAFPCTFICERDK